MKKLLLCIASDALAKGAHRVEGKPRKSGSDETVTEALNSMTEGTLTPGQYKSWKQDGPTATDDAKAFNAQVRSLLGLKCYQAAEKADMLDSVLNYVLGFQPGNNHSAEDVQGIIRETKPSLFNRHLIGE